MSRDPLDPASDAQSSSRSNRDLIAASVYAVAAAAALLVGDGLPPAVRVPIALPLLLFVPGYVVVTALLPRDRPASVTPGSGRADGLERRPSVGYDGLATLERFTLALVTSVAIVPTIALVANAVVGVSLRPVLVGVVVVTLLGAVLAATRRAGSAAASSGLGGASSGTSGGNADPTDAGRSAGSSSSGLLPTNTLTLAAVAISILLLATSAAVAFSGAGQDRAPTELSVGTASGGEFVADGYPAAIGPDEPATVDVAVEHGGDEARDYEVIATLDAVEYDDVGAGENGSTPTGTGDATTVTSSTELDRYETTVEPDERAIDSVELRAPADVQAAVDDGDGHRVAILLYEDEAPDEPDHEAAHRTVSFPVEVVGGES